MTFLLNAPLKKLDDTRRLAAERLRTRGTGSASRVGYLGALGQSNLGDWAMFEAARALLAPADVRPFAGLARERLMKGLGLGGRRYFGSFLLGGGTLINPNFVGVARAALRTGLPVSALGTGVGSCGFAQPDRVDLAEWRSLLPDFRSVGVRGPRSVAALNDLGVKTAGAVGDLALCGAGARTPTSGEGGPPRFALNVTLAPHDAGASSAASAAPLAELEAAVSELVRAGWRPVPVAMHAWDVAPLRSLLARAGAGDVAVPVLATADAFFQATAPCAFTVAVRLHAAVLSCCVGVPPLMLGYRDKCRDFMESMGLDHWHVALDAAEAGEVAAKTALLAAQAPDLGPVVLERALAWKTRLRAHVRDCF
jgi:polysaccharide pyruvyl transferase WcaK-like protein